MHEGKMVFSQFLELISRKSFQACVDRHRGDWKVKSFYCREFFRVMIFAQITGRSSLSEIVLCLKAVSHHLYHAGIRSTVTKSNLALANNQRSWKIFYDYAQVLIRQATPLYRNDPSELDVDGCVWHVELFFKWIKQHLHVKSFYGRSDNAVRSQLWISVCVYLLIAILKKRWELPLTLNEILQILSVTPFEKMPISSVFFGKITKTESCHNPNQLTFFDL